MKDLQIFCIQTDLVWENPKQNRQHFEQIIQANKTPADLIVLPETFTTGFPVDPRVFAENENGESVAWMRQIATETNSVVTGSLLLTSNSGYSNSLIWMRPDGRFDRYDKRHVFSMGGEHNTILAGKKQLTVQLKGWNIRPMICYDLRFPVWSKNQYNNGVFEYDLALYVANWPTVRSYPWNHLLIARAIENQAFVVGVNRVGKDGLGNDYEGCSKVIDAKGAVLAEAPREKEKAFSVTLSGKELQLFRKKFDVGRDWDSHTLRIEP